MSIDIVFQLMSPKFTKKYLTNDIKKILLLVSTKIIVTPTLVENNFNRCEKRYSCQHQFKKS